MTADRLFYSNVIVPAALSPDNGIELDLYWDAGYYYAYYDYTTNTVSQLPAYGRPRVIRKAYWERIKARYGAWPTTDAGTYASLVLPLAVCGRANIFGELSVSAPYDYPTRIIKKTDQTIDWALNEYLTASGKTGSQLSSGDGSSTPTDGYWATVSQAAGAGVSSTKCKMKSDRVAHYPCLNLITDKEQTLYQPVKPHGMFGGTSAGTYFHLGAKWFDAIYGAHITYHTIYVDAAFTFDPVDDHKDEWILLVAEVQNCNGRAPPEPFAIDIPALDWVDTYTGSVGPQPPTFDRTKYSIVFGSLPGRGVSASPKLVRKNTEEDETSATRSGMTISAQHQAPSGVGDPQPAPISYPTTGDSYASAYESSYLSFSYMTPRAVYSKEYPSNAFAFYYFGPGEDGAFNAPWYYYRVSVNGVFVTDYYQRDYWTEWDWTGVNDGDIYPIYVHAYTKYEEETEYTLVGQHIILPMGYEYCPANIAKVGLPVLFAKSGGLTNMETDHVCGRKITWLEETVYPGDSIPLTITVSAVRDENSISFTIDDVSSILYPDVDHGDYVYPQSTLQFHIGAYIGNIEGYSGIDATLDRVAKIERNTHYDTTNDLRTNFCDFEFVFVNYEVPNKYLASISRPYFTWDASAEIRVKLGLVFMCKMPHRTSRPVYYVRRECTVIIPAT